MQPPWKRYRGNVYILKLEKVGQIEMDLRQERSLRYARNMRLESWPVLFLQKFLMKP